MKVSSVSLVCLELERIEGNEKAVQLAVWNGSVPERQLKAVQLADELPESGEGAYRRGNEWQFS